MILNLNVPVLGLDDKPITVDGKIDGEKITLAKSIAVNMLGKTEGIDSIKAMDWANSLYKTGEINLDASDLQLFKEWVKKYDFTNLFKSTILKIIQAVELAEQNKPKV